MYMRQSPASIRHASVPQSGTGYITRVESLNSGDVSSITSLARISYAVLYESDGVVDTLINGKTSLPIITSLPLLAYLKSTRLSATGIPLYV